MQIIPSFYFNSSPVSNIISSTVGEAIVIQNSITDLLNQLYVNSATWGLDDWDKLLGLSIDTNATLTDRRARVKMALRGQGTFTAEFIKNLCMSFTNGQVEVIEHNDQYYFTIKFVDIKGIPSNMDYLRNALDTYKPAHLNYSFEYKYNVWNDMLPHTWQGVATNTWDNVKIR